MYTRTGTIEPLTGTGPEPDFFPRSLPERNQMISTRTRPEPDIFRIYTQTGTRHFSGLYLDLLGIASIVCFVLFLGIALIFLTA